MGSGLGRYSSRASEEDAVQVAIEEGEEAAAAE
jgi:hypothetical protein